MSRPFANVYDDDARAQAYAGLEYPGTYYLAFRDLPDLLARHVRGTTALDFGCGTGRSTRFLQRIGFRTVGVDISTPMLSLARARDPDGRYQLVPDGDLTTLERQRFDLVLAAFTFDNIPGAAHRTGLLRQLRDHLEPGGRMVLLVSTPEIYLNEWVSFSTRDFPGNRLARSGDRVRITMLDVPDRRPVEDLLWTDADYRATFSVGGLALLETHRPLGRTTDPVLWMAESTVAPWTIYVLGADAGTAGRSGPEARSEATGLPARPAADAPGSSPMPERPPQPEVWLRGPVPDVPAPLQPVAHALLQALEDVERIAPGLTPDELWASPGGAASAGFHLRHMAESLDRLMTYARGETLSSEQRRALAREKEPDPRATAADLLRRFREVAEQAMAQLRATAAADLDTPRAVGRAGHPSTMLGLLYHGGEHTARHTGQLLTTVKIVRGAHAAP